MAFHSDADAVVLGIVAADDDSDAVELVMKCRETNIITTCVFLY